MTCLKKMPSLVDKSSVRMVCVDDFALRKRFSYGTVMVSLENHRIIDMIPSRETSAVEKWLSTFPNIEVVSRDGASTYSSATANSHPDAIQISDRFHLIKGLSYLNPDYSVVNGHYNVRIPGKLAPYEKDVIELRSKGITYPKIHKILCEKGYTGSVASLRMFMQKERTRMHEQQEQSKIQSAFIQRKSLCQLIYKKIEDVTTITANQYEEVLKKYPQLGPLYSLVKDFYSVIFSKKPEKLDDWITSAQKYDIPELQTFLEGLSRDIKAIKNSITYSYNNGLAEGSVNKIKVIKRIMYGRNSFDLLKSKVLFHEFFQSEFN